VIDATVVKLILYVCVKKFCIPVMTVLCISSQFILYTRGDIVLICAVLLSSRKVLVMRTTLQVLVLGPQFLSLVHKVLENCQGLCILQTVCYIWSREVHKFSYLYCTWGYSEEWLTYLLISDMTYRYTCISLLLSQCCCPQGQIYNLLFGLRVLVLEP